MSNYREIKIDTASPNLPQSSILLIYTGGTMGMVAGQSGALVPFNFESILEHIPSLKTFDLHLTVAAFNEPIDSSNIKPSHWAMIGDIICDNYDDYNGFVILHGTDTMAYTSSALSFMLEGLNKPVIMTGAQLPIASARTDARENIITAIEIASAKQEDGQSIIREVSVFFDSVLLRGNRVRKVESQHFDAFASENCLPLAEAGINIEYNYSVINEYQPTGKLKYHRTCNCDVAILKLFPGISNAHVQAILNIDNVKGIILETYGSGNAPTDVWFIEELKKAIDDGVVIMNVSQCSGGRVVQGKYATSAQLKSIGVINGDDITTEAAITKMMVLLERNDIEKDQLNELLNHPISAEMT
jgi:L-asparaginase